VKKKKRGAHKKHIVALLFVVPFTLFLSVPSFHSCFAFTLVSLSCSSQLVLRTRIGQQLGQVLWTFIQYCYLLQTCVPHTYIYYFVCLPRSTYYLLINTTLTLQSRFHSLLVSVTNQPPIVPSFALYFCQILVRTW